MSIQEELMLSIIMPVYNTEDYLAESLNTLVSQSYNKYEIIIVNDGSTDNSSNIITEFSLKYDYIKFVNQENSGQGAARNHGISLAKGKYIYFMDSDDLLKKNSLRELVNILEKNKLDSLFFDGDFFYDIGFDSTNENFNPKYNRSKSYGFYSTGEDLLFDLIKNKEYTVSPCLYIVRKSILDINDLRFEEGIIHEDEIFTFQIYLASENSMHKNSVYFHRRIRNNSTMTSLNYFKKFNGYITVLNKFIDLRKTYTFNDLDNVRLFNDIQSNLYRKLIVIYKNNKEIIPKIEYEKLLKIGQEFDHFDKLGKLAVGNFTVYSFLLQLKKKISNTKKV